MRPQTEKIDVLHKNDLDNLPCFLNSMAVLISGLILRFCTDMYKLSH
jgi:hypothetical protein